MQKNLLTKTAIIIGILIVFLYGIFGLPKEWNREGLKQAVASRIHLGLDLKGGTHLILQVMVDDAVNAQSDHAIELLKDELTKAKIAYADVSKPDEKSQPERILIKGVSLDGGTQLRDIVKDRLPDYDVSGGQDAWVLTMKATVLNDLKARTVEQSIEAIRTRVDSLGVSEPLI